MSGVADALAYGPANPAIRHFQHARLSTQPFTATLETLRREIESAGLWVLHEIDPQKILRRGDIVIGAVRQILFFHPRLMARLLRADQAALLEAPLKFAVMDLPDGSVTVRWFDPVSSFARYESPELDELAGELATLLETIADASQLRPVT